MGMTEERWIPACAGMTDRKGEALFGKIFLNRG
jgi:hypothetical protein